MGLGLGFGLENKERSKENQRHAKPLLAILDISHIPFVPLRSNPFRSGPFRVLLIPCLHNYPTDDRLAIVMINLIGQRKCTRFKVYVATSLKPKFDTRVSYC